MHRRLWIVLLLQLALALVAMTGAIQAQVAEKSWTIMVFVNADNNLDSAGVADVNEMEKVGSNEQVNVLVQLDRADVEGTHRLYIERDASDEMTSPVMQSLGEVDMGDWKQALDFFEWGVQNYPARRYAFVIWNHGKGWRRDTDGDGDLLAMADRSSGSARGDSKGVSYDDQSGNHIRTTELFPLAEAMADRLGRRIDLLGFDACLMQMAEVASEVKDFVSIQVGAEHVEASDGWPYDEILLALHAKPDMDEKALGKTIVDLYVSSYRSGSQGKENANQSAIDLRAFDGFVGRLDAFAEALMALPHRAGDWTSIMEETQSFDIHQYKDVGDFVVRVMDEIKDTRVQETGKELLGFYAAELVVANGATGKRLAASSGISLWFPEYFYYEKLSKSYEQLSFAKTSRWDEFLHSLYNVKGPALTVASVHSTGFGREIFPGDIVEIYGSIRNVGGSKSSELGIRFEMNSPWIDPMIVDGEIKGIGAHKTRRTKVLRVRLSPDAPPGLFVPLTLVVTDSEGREYRGHGHIQVATSQSENFMNITHSIPSTRMHSEELRENKRKVAFGHLFD